MVLLLGAPISLLRSVLFLSFGAAQSLTGRKLRPTHLLLNTALTVALLDPKALLSPGSLLSFAAVSGILFFYSEAAEVLSLERRWLPWRLVLAQLCLTGCASLLAAPLASLLFGGFAGGAPLANLFCAPLIGFGLPLLYALGALLQFGLPAEMLAAPVLGCFALFRLALELPIFSILYRNPWPHWALVGGPLLAMFFALRKCRFWTSRSGAHRSRWRAAYVFVMSAFVFGPALLCVSDLFASKRAGLQARSAGTWVQQQKRRRNP